MSRGGRLLRQHWPVGVKAVRFRGHKLPDGGAEESDSGGRVLHRAATPRPVSPTSHLSHPKIQNPREGSGPAGEGTIPTVPTIRGTRGHPRWRPPSFQSCRFENAHASRVTSLGGLPRGPLESAAGDIYRPWPKPGGQQAWYSLSPGVSE